MADFKENSPNASAGEKLTNWFENRFPTAFYEYKKHMSEYYAPKNFNVWYVFGALSMLVLGCALLGIGLAKEDAVHALTTGAVGSMTLAVMTRASLGHTGRPKHAGPATVFIYGLVILGAMLRVFGPGTGLPTNLVLGSAGVAWSGAYLLFALVYGPYLVRPSLDE